MRASRFAAVALLSAGLASAGSSGEPVAGAASAERIVERAIRCADASRERLGGYEARHRKRVVREDRAGRPVSTSEFVYRVLPGAQAPAYELTGVDGRIATPADRRREERLREKFRRHVSAGGDAGIEGLRGFEMSARALGRYRFHLRGSERVSGATAWRLDFAPRPGELPVERRLDEALNRSAGSMWIDAEDYGLVAVEFALREPFRVWAGLLGSLTRMEGRFEQTRLAPGVWAPRSMRLRLGGRAGFESLDQTIELDWTDYRLAPAAAR